MSPPFHRGLRAAVLMAAAIGTVFWLIVCARALMVPPGRRDGFEMLGVVLSTGYFFVLVMPTLIMGLVDRWLVFAAVLGAAAVFIATDAIVPWLPWGLLGG